VWHVPLDTFPPYCRHGKGITLGQDKLRSEGEEEREKEAESVVKCVFPLFQSDYDLDKRKLLMFTG